MSEPTGDWGAWDDATQNDPYPRFEKMRATCPVQPVRLADGHDAWLVLGHDAARQALKDSRLSKDMVAALDEDPSVVDAGLPGPAFARHMLAVDPPDHTRLRRLVARAFVPTRIAALESSIERIANDLLDELEASGPLTVVDLIEGFARPLPFKVICELLGVPDGGRAGLQAAFGILFQPWSGSPPPEAVAASDAIVAGHDTTTSLIGTGIVDLLEHSDQLHLLRSEPARMPAAIEELIRFSAPVPHATFRVTTEPVEIGGMEIPAHQQVLVCLGAADRDPTVYDHADVLDIGRESRGHLGFGHGIHFCLGAPLARLEGRVAFRVLLDRFADLRLAVDRSQLRWTHGDGLVLRGLDALPAYLGAPRSIRPTTEKVLQP